MTNLNKNYWEKRYSMNDVPWDIGYATRPLVDYVINNWNKDDHILIPGSGKSHEAIALFRQGFIQTYICDWSERAFTYVKEMCPEFPKNQMIISDFFALEDTFDLILEQTFFCAIDPHKRTDYVDKVAEILNPNGALAGLLFASEFNRPGPPFGGTEEEYRKLFETRFTIKKMELSEKSITPRKGNELFFIAYKK